MIPVFSYFLIFFVIRLVLRTELLDEAVRLDDEMARFRKNLKFFRKLFDDDFLLFENFCMLFSTKRNRENIKRYNYKALKKYTKNK